jgi:DnaJ-class molecular chaperone
MEEKIVREVKYVECNCCGGSGSHGDCDAECGACDGTGEVEKED